MTEETKIFEDFSEDLSRIEISLLTRKKDTFAFLETKHKANAIKEQLHALRQDEADIDQTILSIIRQPASPAFKKEAQDLCARGRELYGYTRDTNQALLRDLDEHTGLSGSDFLRNIGAFVAIIGSTAGIIKTGVLGDDIPVDKAMGVSGVLGGAALGYKSIGKAFKTTAQNICSTKKKVQESFLVYYITESVKQIKLTAQQKAKKTAKIQKPTL